MTMHDRILSPAIALIAALALAACAGPQTRVEDGLVEAGIAQPKAQCMAGILVDKLSVSQLRRLGELKDLREQGGEDATLDYYLKNSKALQDPEILAAAGEAIMRCP